MNKKELIWEEVRANLNLTEEEAEIKKEEEIIDAVIAARKKEIKL